MSRLSDERDYLETCLNREIARNVLLEKQIVDERKSKDKFMLRYCDQVSVQNKLYATFSKDAEAKEPDKPLELSPDEEAEVRWTAKIQRDADIDAGMNVSPIEEYENAIREKGVRNLII